MTAGHVELQIINKIPVFLILHTPGSSRLFQLAFSELRLDSALEFS